MRRSLSLFSLLTIATITLVAAVGAVSAPACEAYGAPHQEALKHVRTKYVKVPGDPFGLVYAVHQKNIAFVSLDITGANSTLGVLNTKNSPPRLIHKIPLPADYVSGEGALGLTLTHNGRHLLVAAGQGAIIINTALAASGSRAAVVGTLNGTTGRQNPGAYAIEVTVDDHYAFVSQEYGLVPGNTTGNIDVFRLHAPTAKGSVSATAIGYVSLGYAVVGTALSPDGSTLYAVSETTTANDTTPGFLSVLDVNTLKHSPTRAVLANVTAGCGPVRIIVSADGEVVWVTARESNHLLAFDARKLVSQHPQQALRASVQVGTSPVGLSFARNETLILTADSNRFSYPNATTGLSVVDVRAALAGRGNAVLGRVPTGLFPREIALSPDGETVLVANYLSEKVQAVAVASLP